MNLSVANGRKFHRFFQSLYFQVIIGILAGLTVGVLYPKIGVSLKPLGDGFIKLIRMMIAPVVFFTVVIGIANIGDTRKLGRVGIRALLYFEVVTTFALLIGYAVTKIFHPGSGMNIAPSSLDPKQVNQYTASAKNLSFVDVLLNIIPDTVAGAFTGGEILQVLFIAILAGLALVALKKEKDLLELIEATSRLSFKIVGIVMHAAPIGAFGAMAFTIGRYGIGTILSLGKLLLCVYLTCFCFVFIVLGFICFMCGISLWRFLSYIREELLIVLGTSSSEPALPGLLLKMERMGCSKSVAGLVIPAGYSFNLDGTSIYLVIAALFIAQATGTKLSLGQEMFVILMLMVNSKGAATVTGGGFITLAATLAALGTIPVGGIALLLGVDRFMSECRAITNLIGNGVATIVIAKWENEFDVETANRVLRGEGGLTLEHEDVVESM